MPLLVALPNNLKKELTDKDDESQYVNVFTIWEEVRTLDFYRSILAEFFATMFFVGLSIFGTLSTYAIIGIYPVATFIWIIVFHTLLFLMVVYTFSHLSGAHFNPAITTSTVVAGRTTLVRGICYVGAQLGGAITGAALVYAAVPGFYERHLATPVPLAGVTVGGAIACEFFLTFVFIFVMFSTAFDPRGWGRLGPIAISTIIGLNISCGYFITGPAMNPARVFGPAVISGVWRMQYVYWVGDIVGGVAAAWVYQYIFMTRTRGKPSVPSTAGDNYHFIRYRSTKDFGDHVDLESLTT